ncbi:MAG: type II toxin-antitoxin system Phd/YefM family antitoxin [Spirochaetales bacterium]|nr:type II toxin-antitoxin system Phd/YefM family antitoxin [Spirochaetales bacterium]
MRTMTVANLKSQFSSVLNDLRHGEKIIIEYGKSHEKLGVIIPYNEYKPKKRKIGILGSNASFTMKDDFKMTDEELVSL